jgi:hypothetical protein
MRAKLAGSFREEPRHPLDVAIERRNVNNERWCGNF